MSKEVYNGLANFILKYIRPRAGMYLGKESISRLSVFNLGYRIGFSAAQNSSNDEDPFFDAQRGFYQWFLDIKGIKDPQWSTWDYPFLQEADGNQSKALDLYFEYLEKYFRETNSEK